MGENTICRIEHPKHVRIFNENTSIQRNETDTNNMVRTTNARGGRGSTSRNCEYFNSLWILIVDHEKEKTHTINQHASNMNNLQSNKKTKRYSLNHRIFVSLFFSLLSLTYTLLNTFVFFVVFHLNPSADSSEREHLPNTPNVDPLIQRRRPGVRLIWIGGCDNICVSIN